MGRREGVSAERERALAPYRRGRVGELREVVRCMLIRLMGHEDCGPNGPVRMGRPIPHWFPAPGMPLAERTGVATVAEDILRELGYDAAASTLREWAPRGLPFSIEQLPFNAKRALEILEIGPPSIFLDSFLVLRQPMYRLRGTRWDPDQEVIVAKLAEPNTAPWVRYHVGRSGRYDRTSEVCHAGHFRTLREAKMIDR